MEVDYILECFSYDNSTGLILWNTRPVEHFKTSAGCSIFNGQNAGKACGNRTKINKKDYMTVAISHPVTGVKRFTQHRLAWLLHHKVWPADVIDHINGDGTDNRIENLRDVSMSVNHKNKRLTSGSTSGFMGVNFMKSRGKWRARIQSENIGIHLGLFNSKEDAISARKEANIKYGFHENHGRKEEIAND